MMLKTGNIQWLRRYLRASVEFFGLNSHYKNNVVRVPPVWGNRSAANHTLRHRPLHLCPCTF